MDVQQRGISSAMNTAPYARGPPSPPCIPVPLHGKSSLILHPSTSNSAAIGYSPAQIEIITRGDEPQVTQDDEWTYEQRRRAQSILSFLYLGPFAAARDEKFLRDNGITMVMPVRHVPRGSIPSPLTTIGATAATRALGIPVDPIDVASDEQLPGIFPFAVRKINDHILSRYATALHQMSRSADVPHDAKILVICETGNERSALVVAAYLMAMYGQDLVTSLSFLSMRRFSISYDEAQKRHLATWGDLLRAHRDVAQSGCRQQLAQQKRRIADIGGDEDVEVVGQEDMDDETRFGSRTFVPFADRRDSMSDAMSVTGV